jgi:hypothetical protein
MPRKAIDYSKTIIYKIVCNDLSITDCYVGHTTDFIERKYKHKSICYNPNSNLYNCKVYDCIRNNGGWQNWSMLQIEVYACSNKREAEMRERYWFEELKSKLNCCLPYITSEEKKDQRQQYNKQYRKQNAKKDRQYQKQYYLNKKLKDICDNNYVTVISNGEIISTYGEIEYQADKDKRIIINDTPQIEINIDDYTFC